MAAIAFIGLGQMGSPMASNLLQQGHQLRVFDVNAEAVRHLVDKGATPAANPAQAAKDAEFIITMVPIGDLVRSVLFDQRTRDRGWFEPVFIERLLAEHTRGSWDHASQIWQLLVLELWLRSHLDA